LHHSATTHTFVHISAEQPTGMLERRESNLRRNGVPPADSGSSLTVKMQSFVVEDASMRLIVHKQYKTRN
jgi:hypothetical protein